MNTRHTPRCITRTAMAILALTAFPLGARAEPAAAARPQAAEATKQTPKPGMGLLLVTLLDVDGQPAPGVTVHAYDTTTKNSKELAKASTDKQGRVAFDLPPTKQVTCTAHVKGKPAPISPAPGEKAGHGEAGEIRNGATVEVTVKLRAANF